ncbi:MAG TPA: hypothetical protein VJU59_39630 [Paraburkholderia sp.]|uniref:hypothetical protein n=1 Tax=Paraburkholderia sp. TaxID=1926495 RepID=UPI002B45A0BD|nr:hypothetical protein [Paraburkholderia sp.]HKR45712.1 hypothetical protein [Paraburkholderia sp.]
MSISTTEIIFRDDRLKRLHWERARMKENARPSAGGKLDVGARSTRVTHAVN